MLIHLAIFWVNPTRKRFAAATEYTGERWMQYLKDTTLNKVVLILMICLIMNSCSSTNHSNDNPNRFIKVNLLDSSIRKAFTDYSNDYNFEGKGIIVSNIIIEPDTTTCLMMLILHKDFFKHWLQNRRFVLFDTIDNRIVIISTQLEPYFKFNDQKAFNDSIIDPYLIPDDGGMNNIWEVEYLIAKDTLIKREVKNKLIL